MGRFASRETVHLPAEKWLIVFVVDPKSQKNRRLSSLRKAHSAYLPSPAQKNEQDRGVPKLFADGAYVRRSVLCKQPLD